MDKELDTLEAAMTAIHKDCSNDTMKFTVMRRIRVLAQARERKRRAVVRTVSVLLFILFGWMAIRAEMLVPAGWSTILDILVWIFRMSFFLLCGIFAWVFTISFQAREWG